MVVTGPWTNRRRRGAIRRRGGRGLILVAPSSSGANRRRRGRCSLILIPTGRRGRSLVIISPLLRRSIGRSGAIRGWRGSPLTLRVSRVLTSGES